MTLKDTTALSKAIRIKLEAFRKKFGADVATFHLYDEAQDRLLFPVGVGLRQEEQFEWLPSERGPAATILRVGVPVFAEDAENHPQFRGPFTFDEGVKSGAALPLSSPLNRKFAIVFINYRSTHSFPDEMQSLMRDEALEAAQEISSWMTDSLWGEVRSQAGLRREHESLQRIAQSACEQIKDTEAVIWWSDRTKDLVAVAHSGFEGYSGQIFGTKVEVSGENYIGLALRRQKMQTSTTKDKVWLTDELHREGRERRRWQSAWAFPLAGSGVLTLYTVGHTVLTKQEQMMARTFANQARATIALHNRIRALEALSNVANKLNLVFYQPQELLNVIVEMAARVMEADWITLHQYDSVQQQFLDLEHSVTYPLEEREGLKKPREDRGASAFVRDLGRIIVPSFDEADHEIVDTAHVEHLGVKAYIGVRLQANDETLGVLFFNYRQPREFTRDDITVVNLFADYAASAIRNARLLRRISGINDIGRELTSGIRLREKEIVELIHRQASRLMEMSNSYIALYEKEANKIRFPLAMTSGEVAHFDTRLFGAGRTEEIITTRKPIFHRTKAEAEAWYAQAGHQEYVGATFASWIGVPMVAGEEVLGVIAAYHPARDNVYDDADLEVMEAIANQAAIALDNERLYYDVVKRLQDSQEDLQRRNRNLAALNDIGRELTLGLRLKEEEIVGLIHQQTKRLMDMSNSYIALYNKEKNEISFPLYLEKGKQLDVATRSFGAGLTEAVISTRQHILFKTKVEAEDWYAQPGHQEYVGTISASWIGVPMIAGDDVLGIIAAYHTDQDNVYDDIDLEVMEAIVSQAAIALDNARLFYDVNLGLESRVEELQTVQNIVHAITSELDIGALLNRVAQEARDILSADDAVVYQYDEEFNEFFLQAKLGEQEHFPPHPGGSSEKLIQHGDTVFADDAPFHSIVGRSSFTSEHGVQSCVAAPLRVGDECVGILYVNYYSAPHQFTEDEKRIVRILTDQAALAIQTVGKLHNTNNQLRTVLRSIEVARECETLDELLNTYLRIALEEIGAESGTIQLLDRESGNLVVRAVHGNASQREYQRISIEQGITGRAAREKRPEYVRDVTKDPEYLGFFSETHSELAVPFLVNDEPLGVLNAEHSLMDAFDVNKRRLFELFSKQAAVLIRERTQLEKVHQEQMKNELDASSAHMTRLMAHHIKGYLGSARIQVDNVKTRVPLSIEDDEELNRVDANMRRCIVITQGLFKPYRPGNRVMTDISPLIRDALDRVGKYPEIEAVISIPDGLPKVWIETENAVDYFHEIFNNAIKVIREYLRAGHISKGWIEVQGRMGQDDTVELLFTNNGPRIPRNDWERIFQQFTGFSDTTQPSESFGLGLWGARTFFRRQNGDISVHESDESHTTFLIQLVTKSEGLEI